MTDTFGLSELAAIGRLDAVPLGASIGTDSDPFAALWCGPGTYDWLLTSNHGIDDPRIHPATHLGAAALAYICARLLGASEAAARGASWRTFIDADGGYDGDDGPEGCTEVTLVTMADGRTFGAWILDGHIDNPEAILAVTRRCVQEAADAAK